MNQSNLSIKQRMEAVQKYIMDRVEINDSTGCWEWSKCKNVKGYGHSSPNAIPYRYIGERQAHRAAYVSMIGLIPDCMFVCHRCDNPSCCNPEHLFVGTAKDNSQDMANKGRAYSPVGDKSIRSTLTREQVEEARRLRSNGKSVSDIAEMFNHSASNMSRVLRGLRHGYE